MRNRPAMFLSVFISATIAPICLFAGTLSTSSPNFQPRQLSASSDFQHSQLSTSLPDAPSFGASSSADFSAPAHLDFGTGNIPLNGSNFQSESIGDAGTHFSGSSSSSFSNMSIHFENPAFEGFNFN